MKATIASETAGSAAELRVVTSCLVCEGTDLRAVLRTPPLPVDPNRLFRDPQDARVAVRAQLELVVCTRCGHLFNRAYDDRLVDHRAQYEDSQMFWARCAAYSRKLADDLVQRYAPSGARIVEIGGARRDLSALLRAAVDNAGTFTEPSTRLEDADEYVPEDFVVCRRVLQQLENPVGIAAALRTAIGEHKTPVYVEVPSAARIFASGTPWELLFNHVSYFTENSLAALFRRAGFEVLRCEERFDGLVLGIELRGAPVGEEAPQPAVASREIDALVAFGVSALATLAHWQGMIDAARATGRRVAVWGAGARAVTFLNAIRADHVAYVVDIDARKSGFFVAGSGHRIVGPSAMAAERPDLVIALDAASRDEIAAALAQLAPAAALLVA